MNNMNNNSVNIWPFLSHLFWSEMSVRTSSVNKTITHTRARFKDWFMGFFVLFKKDQEFLYKLISC